ncbi:neurotrophin 1 [Hyalella azteca]|nr:neurotrophin 1 [Hyalella azteca]
MKLQLLALLAAVVAGDRSSPAAHSHVGPSSFQHSSHRSPSASFNFKSSSKSFTRPIRPPTYKPPVHSREPYRKTTPPMSYPSTTTTFPVYEPVRHETPSPLYVTPSYSPPPTYPVSRNTPAYGALPPQKPGPPQYANSYEDIPACAHNTSKSYCLEDNEYPMYEIQGAAQKNSDKLLKLYADFADLNTVTSVDGLHDVSEETYLCASETAYVRPLRAVNTDGRWRIVVNAIKVNYEDITQTVRLEECLQPGQPCPLLPSCYESSCTQKSTYHRFLVYDPYDVYFPFAVESFKLPAACSCFLGSFLVH